MGSIAEAARHLDMTPAAVAQRVKALEAALGSQLIARSGRTVRPTAAGSRILERARTLLRDVLDLKSAASNTELPAGPLRLGATPSTLTGIVPSILKRWVEAYPGIEVHIEPGASGVLRDRVQCGYLDAAILVHPLIALPKTFAWYSLRKEPLILLSPADLRVDDVLEILAREPFIRYGRQSVGGRLADNYLREKGIRVRVRFELDNINPIAKLVAEGLGVSVLPDCGAIGASDPALTRWSLPAPRPSRTIGVLWLRSTSRSQLVEAFISVVSSGCRSSENFTTRSAKLITNNR